MRYLIPIVLAAVVGCGSGSSQKYTMYTKTVVFLGDSLAGGSSHAPNVTTYPNLIPGIVSINRGIGGDTSAQMLARIQECFVPHPETLVLECGLNDIQNGVSAASYRENVEAIIQQCHVHNIKVILCTVPNTSVGDPAPLNASVRSLATEYGCKVADIELALQKPGLLEADGEHPNQQGQNLIAAVIGQAL